LEGLIFCLQAFPDGLTQKKDALQTVKALLREEGEGGKIGRPPLEGIPLGFQDRGKRSFLAGYRVMVDVRDFVPLNSWTFE
jgi:hypothetical protein